MTWPGRAALAGATIDIDGSQQVVRSAFTADYRSAGARYDDVVNGVKRS